MHIVDIATLAVIAVFIIIGGIHGFIEELFHFAAMFGGFIGACFTYPLLYEKIAFLNKTASIRTIIAFVIAYVLIAFSLIVIGWFIKKLVHMTPLGWIDRLLGACVGAGKSGIVILIFFLSVSLMPRSSLKSSFTPSKTYAFITKLPVKLAIPRTTAINKYYDNLKKTDPLKMVKDTKKNVKEIKNKIDKIDTFRTFIDSTAKRP